VFLRESPAGTSFQVSLKFFCEQLIAFAQRLRRNQNLPWQADPSAVAPFCAKDGGDGGVGISAGIEGT
jgi:hypothetical protein